MLIIVNMNKGIDLLLRCPPKSREIIPCYEGQYMENSYGKYGENNTNNQET